MDALLVIDVQKALIAGAYREDAVLAAIRTVSETVRARGGIVVFVQHCHASFAPLKKGNPGWELHDRLDVRAGDHIVEKQASDAFYDTELDDLLRSTGVDHLYVTGLQTEYCVDTTCRSALSRGYGVTLIGDGHTTGDASLSAAEIIAHHNVVLANLAHPLNAITVCASSEI